MLTGKNRIRLAAATVAMAAMVGSANAATVTTGVAWPSTPPAETVDVYGVPTSTSGRNVTGTRQLRQTFQTDTDVALDEIILSASGYTGASFTIKFFEVADFEDASWSAGTQVGSVITVDAGTALGGTTNLSVALTAGEQFTLPTRNTGVQGYGIELESVGTDFAFNWGHAFDGTDYATGRFYREDGTGQDLTYDLGIALVPEPASLALISLGGLLMLRRR